MDKLIQKFAVVRSNTETFHTKINPISLPIFGIGYKHVKYQTSNHIILFKRVLEYGLSYKTTNEKRLKTMCTTLQMYGHGPM